MPKDELKITRFMRLVAEPGATPIVDGSFNGGIVTVSMANGTSGIAVTGGHNTCTNFTTRGSSCGFAGGVLNEGTLTMVDF